jgi:DMSO/TMAO reductase YedYZ molybdopterin-dependent catalytic subunit
LPPPAQSVVKNLTLWESLDSWITPNGKFFGVAHYEWLVIDAATWRLDVVGRLSTPLSFTQRFEGSTTPRRDLHRGMLR